jgi:hypothetical protein
LRRKTKVFLPRELEEHRIGHAYAKRQVRILQEPIRNGRKLALKLLEGFNPGG